LAKAALQSCKKTQDACKWMESTHSSI